MKIIKTAASLLEVAHREIRSVVFSGDCVVDATVGNGHDTLFLSQCVGPSGRVIGFDIQQGAIDATAKRITDTGVNNVTLHCLSHAKLAQVIVPPCRAMMFNLGYLPGADKKLVTQAETTLAALEAAVNLLETGSLLSVMCYPGHPGGEHEAQAVSRWLLEYTDGTDSSLKCFRKEDEEELSPFLLLLRV